MLRHAQQHLSFNDRVGPLTYLADVGGLFAIHRHLNHPSQWWATAPLVVIVLPLIVRFN